MTLYKLDYYHFLTFDKYNLKFLRELKNVIAEEEK